MTDFLNVDSLKIIVGELFPDRHNGNDFVALLHALEFFSIRTKQDVEVLVPEDLLGALEYDREMADKYKNKNRRYFAQEGMLRVIMSRKFGDRWTAYERTVQRDD